MSEIIRTTVELDSACEKARQQGVLAVDTEFIWKCTYRPQLGIVQIGTNDECWAIDCMTGIDASALKSVIEDPHVVKILHDARQDLMHVWHYTGAKPKNVFDTQLAAAFAGFPYGIGLQKLLFEACDIGLAKTETCTDWTQRPLSIAQVKYALDDVRYLPMLRQELLDRSESLCTRQWLEEEMLRYDDSALYDDYNPNELWKRIKLKRIRLDGRGLAILRVITATREEMAKKWNLPRNWLGNDESLVEMAVVGHVTKINHRLKGGQDDTIRAIYAQAIERALLIPESDWPEDTRHRYISEVLAAADDALDWLVERAADLHVDATVIANRATVTAFVDDVNDDTNPLSYGWRYDVVGREMAERFGVD